MIKQPEKVQELSIKELKQAIGGAETFSRNGTGGAGRCGGFSSRDIGGR